MEVLLNKLKVFYKRYQASLGKQFRLVFAITLVVGVGVCLEAVSWMRRQDPNVIYPRVLLSSRSLPENQILSQLDLKMESVPPPKPQGAVTDQDLHLVLGARLTRPIAAGELVTFDMLLIPSTQRGVSKKVPKGMRAYSFEPSNRVPIRVGDRIDIHLVKEKGGEAATLLTEGVLVLAMNSEEDRKQSLLVAVAVDDLPVLEKGQQLGKLIITLRNPEDFEGENKPSRRRAPNLFKKKSPGIQVISEG